MTRKMTSQPLIKSKQTEKTINGISTQVVCTEFSNYIFVVLTQYGKIGTLVSVTPDSKTNDLSNSMFSPKVLLGKDDVRISSMFDNYHFSVGFLIKQCGFLVCFCHCAGFVTCLCKKPGNIFGS